MVLVKSEYPKAEGQKKDDLVAQAKDYAFTCGELLSGPRIIGPL